MARSAMAGWEERFDDYVERLGETIGHADRRGPLRAYTTGLLLPGERKSVEPMAARVDPFRAGAAHQSLHHFVAKAAWDDAALLRAVRDYALPALLERGPVRAWLVDDTGLPKKGRLSVGVARQYCGQLGSRRIVRSRSRSRSRPGTPACRSPTGSTCPRPGPTTRRGGRWRGCRRRSGSRPSPRSRSARSGRRWPTASRRGRW